MANKKISDLPAATPLTGAELVEVVQGGLSKKSTILGARYVARDTYANLTASYAASSYSGCVAYATDILTEVVSNGTRWLPLNGHALIATNNGIPVGLAPTFTGAGGTGTATFGTAVGAMYPKAFWYVPANSLFGTHSAGFYYGEMSSTTAITFYNNTYSPTAGAQATEPVSKTAFGGVITGGTGVTGQFVAQTVTIPGGLLGEHGAVKPDIYIECNNNANAKRAYTTFGGNIVALESFPSAQAGYGSGVVKNRSSTAQRGYPKLASGSSSANQVSLTVDTNNNFDVTVDIHKSNAADYMMLVSHAVYIEATV